MELWHVLNRGVEKRSIAEDDSDRVRFIHDLYAFNDTRLVQHISQPQRNEKNFGTPRELLVNIHAFCLMGNHYHLILSEFIEQGISKFMQKLNMGYAKYFNERHARSGVLWQGKHKKISIRRSAHFLYIPYYVHLNPLDFVMPEWRAGTVTDPEKALAYLRSYRWSSHLDYCGIRNFPSITVRTEFADILGSPHRYEKEIIKIISEGSPVGDSMSIEK